MDERTMINPPDRGDEVPIVNLINITKIYGEGENELKANDDISIKVYKGEFVCIVGKSGSGKSTIMNMIGALDVPDSGEYILNGQSVNDMSSDELATVRNRTIGFIFQQYNLLPKQSVISNVELPLLYCNVRRSERRRRAMEALDKVGIAEKSNNKPGQLSGGQQQRVSVARALVGRPALLLADEPTGALDSKTSSEVLELLKQLNRDGNTVILITHDNSIALEGQRIIRINDGRVVFDDSREAYQKLLHTKG